MSLIDRGDQTGVGEEDRHIAFSIMLSGSARTFYYSLLQEKILNLEELAASTKKWFRTPERT